jgi:hypothetical protein
MVSNSNARSKLLKIAKAWQGALNAMKMFNIDTNGHPANYKIYN